MHRTTSKPKVPQIPERGAAEPEPTDAPDSNDRERKPAARPKEIGGQQGPEPTRYGDWEKNGRCTDF